MPRIGKPEYKKEAPDYPVYTAKDFFALEAELEKFAVDKELPKADKSLEMVHFVPVEGVQKWLIEKGALSNRKEWTIKDISLYKELQDKLNQYDSWCRRREYAQNQSLQEYSNMATEAMAIVDDIPF